MTPTVNVEPPPKSKVPPNSIWCVPTGSGHSITKYPSLTDRLVAPTGVGTVVEEGKPRIEVDGKPFLLETALHADFALVQAFLADYVGNLQYALTARNFNPVIAMAVGTVIVEAENIVPVGVIPPDHVMTPAPVVDYVIASK